MRAVPEQRNPPWMQFTASSRQGFWTEWKAKSELSTCIPLSAPWVQTWSIPLSQAVFITPWLTAPSNYEPKYVLPLSYFCHNNAWSNECKGKHACHSIFMKSILPDTISSDFTTLHWNLDCYKGILQTCPLSVLAYSNEWWNLTLGIIVLKNPITLLAKLSSVWVENCLSAEQLLHVGIPLY